MQPQMPYFLGREAAAGAADDDVPEGLPHARHRRGRARHVPPHVLRDARQLLVRAVLQGGRDRVRDRVHPAAPEARLGPRLGQRPRRRPGAEARPRRGGDRPLGADRHAARADRPAAVVRELLVGRRPGAVRARLGDVLGLGRGGRLRQRGLPARAARAASASSSSGTSSSCRTSSTPTARSPSCRRKNIDTGWGLERVARVVQDVASVYDTDGYQLIMDWVAAQSGVAYGSSADATKAHRVLADHGRGMTFIAAEGVAPSNEGRGYVLRRIVRRAAQHGLRIGMKPPFLPGLADVVIEQMGQAYPELVEHRDEIHRVLAAEEERFGETLERGMAIFEEAAAKGEITGDDAFELQATYGFPIELTQELARERGLGVNDEEYTRLMEEHREISRAGRSGALRAALRRRAAHRVRRLRAASTSAPRSRRTPTSATALPGQARGVAVLSRGRRPGHRRRLDREGRRLARRARRGAAARGRPGARLRGRRLRGGRPRARRRAVERPLSDDGEPHGDAPAPQGAAGGARRPRPPGRLGRASRQAPLRLHASVAADARRSAPRSRRASTSTSSRTCRCGSSRRRWRRRATSAR